MNKKYLKLGVLLVGLLAFFGGTNIVSAGNNCSKDSYYVQNATAEDGEKDYAGECRLYGKKGTLKITARNCDEGQAGRLAGLTIKYDGTTTYLEFTQAGFTKQSGDNSAGYNNYKSIVENKNVGCPIRVTLNPDSWIPFDAHDGSFKFSDSSIEEVSSKEVHLVYSIRNKYYNAINAVTTVSNNEIDENINNVRDALKDNFKVSDANDTFFDSLPTTSLITLPKYTLNDGKYNAASFTKAAENPTQFKNVVEELKSDAEKISKLAASVNNASVYFPDLSSSYNDIKDACTVQVLEGLTRESSNYKKMLSGASYDGAIDNANNVIDSLVSGATENRKNKILDAVKACNKYGADFWETDDTKGTSRYAKFIAKLNEVSAENAALETAINELLEVAKNKGLAINMNDALNKVGSAKDALDSANANLSRALDGLNTEDFSFGQDENYDCKSLIGEEMMIYLNNAYFIIEIVAVSLVIILSMVDFTKSAVSSDADAMKKSWKKLTTRIVMVVILVILPMLVSFTIDLFNIKGIDPDHPICITDGASTGDADSEGDI